MPKHLFLCRHADAVDPAHLLPDFDRNLSASGIIQAQQTGNWLLAYSPVQAVICSPAKRTRQTAQIISEMIRLSSEKIILEDQLYNAHVEKIIKTIAQLPEELNKVILVGHNPGISLAIAELTGTGDEYLEPANLAMVTFDTDLWSEISFTEGKLEQIFRPGK